MPALTAQFKTYLITQKLSPATLANYVSDTAIFLDWLKQQLQEEVIAPINLTAAVFGNYGRWLNDPANRIHPATAQRYFSSLKRFGGWLETARLADSNPAAALTANRIDPTINQLISDFKHELIQQKLARSTVKNYVSDVNNYLLWAVNSIKITDSNSIKL